MPSAHTSSVSAIFCLDLNIGQLGQRYGRLGPVMPDKSDLGPLKEGAARRIRAKDTIDSLHTNQIWQVGSRVGIGASEFDVQCGKAASA